MKHFLLHTFLLVLFCLQGLQTRAQTVIFSENMGTSGATGFPLITSFTGFQNYNCSYSYAGTGNVSASSASSGYTGASGGNNVNLNNGSSITCIISGINTLGFSSISLSYGLHNSSGLSFGTGLTVEVGTSSTTYSTLTRPGNFWLVSGWQSESCTGTIPSTQNLYIRFTNASGSPNFRIDDVTLTGTPTASTNPSAYNAWPSAYTFTNWPSSSVAGTYPSNMIFHYGAVNSAQPTIANITASYNYANAYSLTAVSVCAALISGQGNNGISFVNRNPGNSTSTGNLGEAVLALNTTCRSNVLVAWQAATTTTNGIVYKLIAQYRVGNTGSYTNLPNTGQSQIEYTSPSSVTNYGPIILPASCENQALVQLRWAYYYGGSGLGTGDEINLTNVTVSSSAYPLITSVSNQTLCGGKTQPAITLTGTPAGATYSWTNSNTTIGLAASGSGTIPSFTTAAIATPPDKTGILTIFASLSGCNSTSTFSIAVKGPQTTSAWTGGVSTDWFEHANWTNCVCGSVTSGTISAVSNPSFNPVISGAIAANVGSILLNSGASLSVQSTQSLNVSGDWTNNGTFSSQLGTVLLTGSSTQSLGGSATTSFYNLTLNNSSGAGLSSAQQITGSLQLNAGTFNTANVLTLVANSSGSGKIGPINPAADIVNKVTVQQYAPGGSTGWALLGSPITSALTMADWNDNFYITCQSCPNGSLSGFTSVYSYNETIAGSYSVSAKYIPITSISANLSNGVGYWVYLGNGNSTTTGIMFDVTGTVAKSSCLTCGSVVSLPVTRTNNTTAFDDGWNLLANPLPSPISWTALRNGNTNVDNALYVYNADLSGGVGAYATYINGVTSTTVGGISDTIPMCQGFYVHASVSTALQATESTKLNSNSVLLRTASVIPKPIVRLVLNDTSNFSDMTTFYFQQGGTISFQTDFDAYKLIYDASLPFIAGVGDSVLTSINGLPPLYTNITIPVKAITSSSGAYTLSLLKTDFPDNICITLYDSFTQQSTDLLSSSYSCQLYDTTSTARFSLRFFSLPLQGSAHLQQPSCVSVLNGTLMAVGSNSGPWNYEWTNGNTVIKTTLAKTSSDSLVVPAGGNYLVRINTTGQCDNYSHLFNVNTVVVPIASFVTNTTSVSLSGGGQINFTNTSSNAQFYLWNFGDQNGVSLSINPSYSYSLPGNYKAQLIAQSSSGCLDSASTEITVLDDITDLKDLSAALSLFTILLDGPGNYHLSMNLNAVQDVVADVYDLSGQKLKSYSFSGVKTKTTNVDLEAFAPGIYYLRVNTKSGTTKTFKLLR